MGKRTKKDDTPQLSPRQAALKLKSPISKPWRYDPFKSGFARLEFRKPLLGKLAKFQHSRTETNIRVRALKLDPNRWGSGLDEMVQTRLLRDNPKKFSWEDLSQLHQRERIDTPHLIWATSNGADTPLAGHTPALKNHEGRSTKGTLTAEHGTRDGLREKAILQESNARDWGIKARLATIKYMMSPGEELRAQKGRLAKLASPIYSIHRYIGDLRKSKHLDKLSDRQQEIRERLKWHTASEMLSQGHGNHVPSNFKTYLQAHGDAPKAMEAFRKDAHAGNVKNINNAPTSQTDDLSSHSLASMGTGRKRALSETRLPPVKPPF